MASYWGVIKLNITSNTMQTLFMYLLSCTMSKKKTAPCEQTVLQAKFQLTWIIIKTYGGLFLRHTAAFVGFGFRALLHGKFRWLLEFLTPESAAH